MIKGKWRETVDSKPFSSRSIILPLSISSTLGTASCVITMQSAVTAGRGYLYENFFILQKN